MPYKDPEKRRLHDRAWKRAYAAAHPEIVKERARAKHARHRAEDNARNRASYQRHRADNLRIAREYYHAHKEERQAKNRVYNLEHAAEKAEYNKQYRLRNLERLRAAEREYRRTHLARIKERERAIRATKTILIKTKNRTSYIKNQKQRRAYAKAYRLAHPEAGRINVSRRRARKLNAPLNDLTTAQWREIKEHYGHRCVYCGRKMARLTMDHIIPLAKGGSHTASNVVPACQPCNFTKHTGPPPVPVQPVLLTLASASARKATKKDQEDLLVHANGEAEGDDA